MCRECGGALILGDGGTWGCMACGSEYEDDDLGEVDGDDVGAFGAEADDVDGGAEVEFDDEQFDDDEELIGW